MKSGIHKWKNKSSYKKTKPNKNYFNESVLRTIGFIATLILASLAILNGVDSPVVWAFLGYAIGSSNAGIKSI